jgi:hypothetical protein
VARIRSIHPGFFTDEEIVTVSMGARLLVLGLGIEADDKGVFEWKPLTVKMKVFPADNIDIDTMLAELEHANVICRYEIAGRSYGAIRNFRKHQRPKTPNDVHPAPPEIRKYVGLAASISETLPQSSPKGSEIRPQMEDGGWRMEDGEEENKKKDAGKRPPAAAYAFSGHVIRLNAGDLATWRKSYHAIPDIMAELTSLDSWLSGQPEAKQKAWFHTVSGSLNRKHQELLTSQRQLAARGGELELPIA